MAIITEKSFRHIIIGGKTLSSPAIFSGSRENAWIKNPADSVR